MAFTDKHSIRKTESRRKKPRYDDSEDDISISSMSDSDEESDEFVEEEKESGKKTGRLVSHLKYDGFF